MSDAALEPLWPSLLESVTAEDIQRVAATYCAADRASYSVVRPEGVSAPSEEAIRTMMAAWPPKVGSHAAVSAETRREILPNGLTLLLRVDRSAPVVAVHTMARGGLWIESDALSGLSNMTATLLRRGAGSMSAREISDRLDALGMTLQSDGTSDYAQVSWRAPSRSFAKAWELYRNVLLKPTFPPGEVAKVREDLLNRVRSLGDRPFEYTNLQFQGALYRKSPYRRPVIGDTLSLPKIQTADLRKAYETMFCAKNLVVSIVGDFDADQVLETARSTFATLRPGAPVSAGGVSDEPADERRVRFVDKDQEQVTYNTGWLACSVRDRDYVPLRVAVTTIGNRLFFKYVYEKGVAYRSWFYMQDRLGQASAQNEMGVTPANFGMASSGVLEDIARFTRDGMASPELRRIQGIMLSRYFLGAQSAAEQAQRLCYYETAGLGYEFGDRYPELLRKVTAAEVNAAARKYFNPATYTRVAVGKEPPAAKGSTAAPSH
jgi:predicted Zn-dependent peptidase